MDQLTALNPIFSSDIDELGTQVFIYDPRIGNLPGLTELTLEPGIDGATNKYSWSMISFDGDGNGVEELYVGTLNSQTDYIAAAQILLLLNEFIFAGFLPNDFSDTDALFDALGIDVPTLIDSEGGELWRYDFETQEWTQVAGPDLPFLDEGDIGFREMQVYEGQIYAATSSRLIYDVAAGSNNPAKIIVSSDGETWTQLNGGPLDDPENLSIRSMDVVGEVLIVGTENINGAEVWAYDNDGTWTQLGTLPAPTHAETFTTSAGETFIGTWAPYGLFKLTLPEDGGLPVIEDVTPVGVGAEFEDGVIQIIEFQGHVYVGSADVVTQPVNGTAVYRSATPSDPNSWEIITLDGFETDGQGNELLRDELRDLTTGANGEDLPRGVQTISYTWQMEVVDDVLYVGDVNGQRALLLSSTNGTDWEIVNDEDDFLFGGGAIGIRSLTPLSFNASGLPVPDGEPNVLAVGTADLFTEPAETDSLDDFTVIFDPKTGAPLTGTDGQDIILGGGLDNVIDGLGGADLISADLAAGLLISGDDTINGGAGQDIIAGNGGDDVINGGTQDDIILGGFGNDEANGDAGNDVITGDVGFGTRLIDLVSILLANPLQLPLPSNAVALQADAGDALDAAPAADTDGDTGDFQFTVTDPATQTRDLLVGVGFAEPNPVDGLLSIASPVFLALAANDAEITLGDSADPDVAAGALDFIADLQKGMDPVFEQLFGQDAAETFGDLDVWYQGTQRGNGVPLANLFGDATIELDQEFEAALLQVLEELETILDEDVSTLLGSLSQILSDLSNGVTPDAPTELIEAAEAFLFDLAFPLLVAVGNDQVPPSEVNTVGGEEFVFGPILATILGPLAAPLEFLVNRLNEESFANYDQGFVDTIFQLSGITDDVINGGAGTDLLFGSFGNDWIAGGDGIDVMFGNGGVDTLIGGNDQDILRGGDNNDYLIGGPGNDVYDGGDTFFRDNGNGVLVPVFNDPGDMDVAVFDGSINQYAVVTGPFGDGSLAEYLVVGEGTALPDTFNIGTIAVEIPDDGGDPDAADPVVLDVTANDVPAEVDQVLQTEIFEFDDVMISADDAASPGFIGSRWGPDVQIIDVNDQSSLGDVEIINDTQVVYHPATMNIPENAISPNGTVTDQFTYTINQGGPGVAPTTATVTIQYNLEIQGEILPEEVEDPIDFFIEPIGNGNDTFTVNEDAALVNLDVLQNDGGVPGVGVAIVSVDTAGTSSTVFISDETRSLIYTPSADFQSLRAGETAVDSFSYTTVDELGTERTFEVRVTVVGSNDSPIVLDRQEFVRADGVAFFGIFPLDADGEQVEVVDFNAAALNGTVEQLSEQVFSFTPGTAAQELSEGEFMTETFDVQVSDGSGGTDVATFTIVIEGVLPVIEELLGTAADDSFLVEAFDTIREVFGEAGEDVVSIAGEIADFALSAIEGGFEIAPADGTGEATRLFDIDTLVFDDGTLQRVFDEALVTLTAIFELTYDREADIAGLSYWFDAFQDGFSLAAIADAFATAEEFSAIFGDDVTNREFVQTLYAKGLDRGGDDAGIEFWTGQLNDGLADRGDMILNFAQSAEIREILANEIDDGIFVLA